MIPPKKLSVTIHDAEFAKDFQYSISGQFNAEKVYYEVMEFRKRQTRQQSLEILYLHHQRWCSLFHQIIP